MAYTTKYNMRFYDLKNVLWNVDIKQDNFSGNVTALLAGPEPLTIRYEGDETNIFDEVRKSKAVINFLVTDETTNIFYETNSITEKTLYVEITNSGSPYTWGGWLLPDERQARIVKKDYYITLTAIDPLSLAEGRLFTDESGSILQGKTDFYHLLNYALKPCTNISNDIRIRVNAVINYEGATVNYPPYNNVLWLVKSYAENYIQSNERPAGSLETVQRIMKGLGMTISFINQIFVIRQLMALFPENIATYTTQEYIFPDNLIFNVHNAFFNGEGPLLMGNTDTLTADRPYKELSQKFIYDNIASIIVNPQFIQFDGTGWPGWENHLIGGQYALRGGNGRPQNPFSMDLYGAQDFTDADTGLKGMAGHSYREVKKGAVLRVSIKFKFYDWWRENPTFRRDIWPALRFRLRITKGGTTWYYYYQSPGSSGNPNNEPIGDLGWYAPSSNWCDYTISSTDAYQNIDFTTTPVPIDGTLYIEFIPLFIFFNQLDWSPVIKMYRLFNVAIGEQVNSDENPITGETHYITQSLDFSQVAETETVEIGDTPIDTVSGALFKNGTEGHAGELTTYWVNTVQPVSKFNLIKNNLRVKMFYARASKLRIEADIFAGGELTFEKLLTFANGTNYLIPGKYLQLTSEFKVRACMHHIVAVQLTGSFRDTGTGADEYEDYFDYQNTD